VVATVDVHVHATAMHVFGLKQVPTLLVFPAGLGARFPLKVPYSEALPEQHYVERIRRVHALAADKNGDAADAIEAIADFSHAAEAEFASALSSR